MGNQKKVKGKYEAATRFENIIITAGMTPRDNGKLIKTGRIQKQDSIEDYREAVRLSAKNALNAAETQLNQNESIGKLITFTCYINAEEGYESHAKIAYFASGYLEEQLGSERIGSRAAIGVQSLPGNAPIEIQLTLGVRS